MVRALYDGLKHKLHGSIVTKSSSVPKLLDCSRRWYNDEQVDARVAQEQHLEEPEISCGE
jgi:hypothetical protein